jgi:peptide/nickel transport system substrate-binding protein
LTYSFKIRGTDGSEPSVKFHSGNTLTTEDVEYSFERDLVLDLGLAEYLYDDLLGLPGSRDENGNFIVSASQIDNAITHNETCVVLHLVKPFTPLLEVLASPAYAPIVDKKWCVSLGEWPGTWNNWTDYNQVWPTKIQQVNLNPPSPHENTTGGTGPFTLDYVIPREEMSFIKFDDYWRGWPASGATNQLERVTVRRVSDWQTRKNMFLSGESDSLDLRDVPMDSVNELLGQPGVRCIYPLSPLDCAAMLFTLDLNTSSQYLGVQGGLPSGSFSENGIPPDFFNDVKVRKAFAYAFNYSQLIDEELLGDGYRPATCVLPNVPFWNPAVKKFDFDLTEAEQCFRAAWNGELWTNGFNFTICKRSNSIPSEIPFNRACEILKANVESINPKFHIQIEESFRYQYGLLLDYHELPVSFMSGEADLPDPHDFVSGFMYSEKYFARAQNYANATVDELIMEGRTATGTDREQAYYELQRIYHEDCPSVPLYQPRLRKFERDWVQGWYFNPLIYGGGNYFYVQWKEDIPPVPLLPGENLVNAIATTDSIVTMNTTVAGNLTISSYDIGSVGSTPEGYEMHSIRSVTIDTTVPHANIVFPIEVRVYYTDQEVVSAYIDQSTLRMFYWSGTDWILESDSGVVSPSDVEGYTGYVWARIWHLSQFAAMGQPTLIHAIAPKAVRSAKSSLGEGFMTTLTVDAFNQGNYEETFNISVFANNTLVGSFTNVSLAAGNSATLSLATDTSTLTKGAYQLVAVAEPVPGENYTIDNTFFGDWILVTVPGNLNKDTMVDIYDAIILANAYNSKPGSSNWNSNADINSDNIVDIYDAIILANHFNQHYP